jgi:hypothetical protein
MKILVCWLQHEPGAITGSTEREYEAGESRHTFGFRVMATVEDMRRLHHWSLDLTSSRNPSGRGDYAAALGGRA